MASVAARELRNGTRGVLDRVLAGEEIVITLDGLPVARFCPLAERPQAVQRDAFLDLVERWPADPELAGDLRDLFPETTDDEPL
jgi:prevent-host-death family protein